MRRTFFRSINSKFYVVFILLFFLFIAGYGVLAYFLHQQNRSVTLARDAVLLERNISTLNKYFHEVRFWEQVILTKNTSEAERSFAALLSQISSMLTTLNGQQLNAATQAQLEQIKLGIKQYETRFNVLVQLNTKQRIQNTRMETNYRSMVSIVLNSNNSSLLKPLYNFTHFLITYRSAEDSPKYQALVLVIESFEKKIKSMETIDDRMLDYLESFKYLLNDNYVMELEILTVKWEVENINSRLQKYFSSISAESEAVIKQKLEVAVDIRQELQRMLLASAVLGVLFLLLIHRHISKGIIAPIKLMSHVVQAVKDGDIGARFRSHIAEDDEIAQLGLSFNNMLETLEANNLKLLGYQQDLEDKVNELSKREIERKKLTARIQRIEKMEAIGTLAGGVAHDLNNILSGVVSYPELLLLDLPDDSPYREPILTIQESGKKAAAIVQDLLTLARRGVTVTDVVNLNTLITDYLLTPEYKKMKSYHSAVDIQLNLAEDLFNISGSPVHLTKTIMNLVSNGAESISGEGTVCIETENRYITEPISGYNDVEEGDYAVMILSDTGVGIPPANLDRIFEPFFTNKEMGQSGTGLGLAVIWGTVQDHNGYIDVQSIEGKGTRFSLYFPVTKRALSKTDLPLSISEYMGKGQSILVVDDTDSQREIAAGMLRALGYVVATVASGEEAVEYIEHQSSDLLILDMIMAPGIDGLETYKRILKYEPNQKAIITSGYSETNRVKEAQKAGAATYISKPYTLERIGIAVKEELER